MTFPPRYPCSRRPRALSPYQPLRTAATMPAMRPNRRRPVSGLSAWAVPQRTRGGGASVARGDTIFSALLVARVESRTDRPREPEFAVRLEDVVARRASSVGELSAN